MTVEELLSRISSRELSEWQAYDRLDPFGETRADLRSGIVAALMANLWGRKKGQKPFAAVDFMPTFEPKAPQSPEQMLAIVESMTTAMGGKDLRSVILGPDGKPAVRA